MTREKLAVLSYPSIKEKKLRYALINSIEQYGFKKTYINLTENNYKLLNLHNIDNNDLNFFLVKNYILTQNSHPKVNILDLSDNYEKEIIVKFDNYINDNDFYNAFNLYEKNYFIFTYLCLSYMRNLSENNISLLYKIPDNRVNYVYNKLLILLKLDLTNQEIKRKKYIRKFAK